MNQKRIRLILTTKCNLISENQNIENNIVDPEHIVKNIKTIKEKYSSIGNLLLTGEEPTLYPYLEKFLKNVRSLFKHICINSNGTNREILLSLRNNNLVDEIVISYHFNQKEKVVFSIGDKIKVVVNDEFSIH